MNTHILSRSLSQLKAPAVVWYGDAKEFPAAEDPDELIGIENVTAMVTRGYASAPEPALFVQLGVSSKVALCVRYALLGAATAGDSVDSRGGVTVTAAEAQGGSACGGC